MFCQKTIDYFPSKNSGINVKIINALGVEELVDKRKAWEKVLLMGKPVTKNMRVCSKHFTIDDYCSKGVKLLQPKLKRNAVPTQNLPTKRFPGINSVKNNVKNNLLRRERLLKRKSLNIQSKSISDIPLCLNDNIEYEYGSVNSEQPRTFEMLTIGEKIAVNGLLNLVSNTSFIDAATQVCSGDLIITFCSTIKKDSHLNSLTGIPSFDLLDSLVRLVTKFYRDQKRHKLCVKDRIILVFMKLKLALQFNILSFLFQICPTSCKNIFKICISQLASILKPCIYWTSSENCLNNMPLCFSMFNSVRTVFDCIEIPIQKPKCLCCRIRTYSHYKGRLTIKFMTGVSPDGLITFVSKGYGGRSSDKTIFEQRGVLTKLDPHKDSIMVDKGFLIDTICKQNFIKIVRPYFLRNKNQFTKEEAQYNVFVAKARVHVERVNQRIRMFEILNKPLSSALLIQIDDIMSVICGMVNLQKPVLASDKF